MVPFFPLLVKDMVFLHEANESRDADGLVNFEKLRMISRELARIEIIQAHPYDARPEGQSKDTTLKGSWQQSQAIRKVRAFLAHLHVCYVYALPL